MLSENGGSEKRVLLRPWALALRPFMIPLVVDADRQLEGLVAGAADPWHVHAVDTGSTLGGIAVAETAQHAFDDIDVMLSAIQATHRA